MLDLLGLYLTIVSRARRIHPKISYVPDQSEYICPYPPRSWQVLRKRGLAQGIGVVFSKSLDIIKKIDLSTGVWGWGGVENEKAIRNWSVLLTLWKVCFTIWKVVITNNRALY